MSGSDPRSGPGTDADPSDAGGGGPDDPDPDADSDPDPDEPPLEYELDPSTTADDAPASVSGKAAFLRALNVRRNAAVGLAIGALIAGAAFVLFAVLPETSRPAVGYLALAFVLAVSLGALLAVLFTIGSAIRLARAD